MKSVANHARPVKRGVIWLIRKLALKERVATMESNKGIEGVIKTSLRSIAASFPVAASLAQAWNEYENRIQLARIEEFFHSFKQAIESMEDRLKEVEDYILRSGEIPPLLERTIQRVKSEQSDKKRKSYVRLLAESIAVGNGVSYDHKYAFIEILDTLTEQDLNILMRFRDGRTLRGTDLIDGVNSSASEQHASSIILSLSKLEARGLISETDSHGYSGDTAIGGWGTEEHWLNRWRSRYLSLLPYGHTFLNMTMEKGRTPGVGPR